MPVHWAISHRHRLVLAVARDELRPAEMQLYLEGVAAEGGMPYGKILDMTAAPEALTPHHFHVIGERIDSYTERHALGPFAIVAAADGLYAQARAYAAETVADRPLRIFRELHTARHWLDGQPPTAVGTRPSLASNEA